MAAAITRKRLHTDNEMIYIVDILLQQAVAAGAMRCHGNAFAGPCDRCRALNILESRGGDSTRLDSRRIVGCWRRAQEYVSIV